MTFQIENELTTWGPLAPNRAACSRDEARDYCRRLARSHYENFHVASWLLPRHLRPHFCAVYAYCRWSDDLADETSSPARALALLAWWEDELRRCFAGNASHPVFVALRESVTEFSLPIEPFRNLLVAFRQDQRQTRYETWHELLDYCRHSANPVGRIVLHLGRCHNAETAAFSDAICTGLQLANFLQDLAVDYRRGRIYLPREAWREHALTEADFAQQKTTDSFRQMMAAAVARARSLYAQGEPLLRHVPRELKIDISLFLGGGVAILDAITRQQFDVWTHRPTVRNKPLLLARAILKSLW